MAKSKWPQVEAAIKDGRITQWLRDGQLEKTIAKNLGVSVGTWEKYKTRSAELREAIKNGNRVIVQEIEDALVKRALGYDYTESKMYRTKDKDGNVKTHEEVFKKHMPADTGAAIFLLKNKAKDRYQNDPQVTELRKMELELKKQIAESTGLLFDMGGDNDGNTGA